MKITPEGNLKVTGLEVIDVAIALSALNIARAKQGGPEPRELSVFETLSLRVAAARGRERRKLMFTVYDTESLTEGLSLIEEDARQQLSTGDLSRSNLHEQKDRLSRINNMRTALGSLAARNSK